MGTCPLAVGDFQESSMCRQRINCSSFFSPMSGICYTGDRTHMCRVGPFHWTRNCSSCSGTHGAILAKHTEYQSMVDTWLFAHETTVSYCRQSQSVIQSNKRTTTILIPQYQKPPQKVTVGLDRELHNVQEPTDFYTSKSRRLLDRSCFFHSCSVAFVMQRIPQHPGLQTMQHIYEPFKVLLFCLYEDDDSMIQKDEACFPCQPLIAVVIISWNTAGALPRLNAITLNRKSPSASFPCCEELALRQSDSQLPISEDDQRSLPDILRTSTTDDGFKHTSIKHFAQNMDYDSIMRKREMKRWLSLWAGITHLDFRPHQIQRSRRIVTKRPWPIMTTGKRSSGVTQPVTILQLCNVLSDMVSECAATSRIFS
ncbi:hypothetical protein T11_2881 [Trichinella zimbabwensis]|uniref:Uncharacterized protein n=1 Tax=Trichinella zimbabwensis TaxID=268475 RepID=A0A0V1GUM3_9BILA|nr:hypothetical protein T11_2881 [Trichinella zimbabwensis]